MKWVLIWTYVVLSNGEPLTDQRRVEVNEYGTPAACEADAPRFERHATSLIAGYGFESKMEVHCERK